ncbi:MAG: tRNA (N(6)-L-threonylcarbamoyladenosine(37)-C(2))-methylthiotransferase MtaB [Candidatus Schekmanbacteria bacterium GWA2_38_11]|uniref:Threonylcarbamoyladenosine tRNA methylthiotransferase MtaB n=1 Tax=Candidatus Schekmanbacteria bacterium GWA2_38_11 TaxID=1817876 RepID=A0A1F7RPT6_9BACT|nr:MAG: tRNA (N(6)-L-threonylcarbamoyladenosine(37)-C(2))-methylthiotransferase MtaB [Candidatus Schekmanbacteria bacterium GWA2_38_11]
MRIAFYTLGCKANQFDEAAMKQVLEGMDVEFVPFNNLADIYIINTCTVTAKTDYQARQAIRNAVKRCQMQQSGSYKSKVIVTGCYAQVNKEEIKAIPGVSLVLGNQEKAKIDKYIGDFPENGDSIIKVSEIINVSGFDSIEIKNFGNHTRAFVKIQDGCNSRCSYCIVPYARGKNRSLEIEKVKIQIERLLEQGYREIVLTGIHLGTYGEDFCHGGNLSRLLQQIETIKGKFRIRLSSIEPLEITDELINVIASSERIAPHLHIPLQSGDDEILKKMNRNYNAGFYKDLVAKLINKIPNLNIGADVIVGFPAETDDQFKKTYMLINGLPLSYLHVFPFSKRALTPAALLPEQITHSVCKERSSILRELGEKKKLEFRTRFIGKTMSVLVEEKKDRETGLYKGFTENYIPVLFNGKNEFKKKLIPVKLNRIEGNRVFGEINISLYSEDTPLYLKHRLP